MSIVKLEKGWEVYDTLNEMIEEINLLKGEFPSQTPSEDWTITQIKSWLDQEDIDYNGVTLKSELLALTSDE